MPRRLAIGNISGAISTIAGRPSSTQPSTANSRIEQRTGTRPLTFESSPYYMFHPLAAERIAQELRKMLVDRDLELDVIKEIQRKKW